MTKTIAVLATLDTKGVEAQFLREQLEGGGCRALIVDMGVIGEPGAKPDITREALAEAGGSTLSQLLEGPTREVAAPTMVRGAIALLKEKLDKGELDGVLGIGGLQGTAACSEVMRSMPYGFPKVMVSTTASGDVGPYVGTKDITMMFSVGDILGLNRVMRRILANAAGAVRGMAEVDIPLPHEDGDRPLIGMTNLGVLTRGAMHALELFEEHGYEVIVFHAIGSGGRAMEEMMEEGVIGAVFDYAMGEIADDVFGELRAGGPKRLTVAGALGLPQVLCPGGSEHLGILVEPNEVPERWKDHTYVFHNPVVFVPRLNSEEFVSVAEDIGKRLQTTTGKAVMMLPTDGTGSYAMPGGPLRDEASDAAFFDALKSALPDCIEVVESKTHAEDPEFVRACVERLIAML